METSGINPDHLFQTKDDGLSFDLWLTAYNAERVRLGLKPSNDVRINGERYDLNEFPADMAECDRARNERLAEGWHS